MTDKELKQLETLQQENAYLKKRLQKLILELQRVVVEREKLALRLKNGSKSNAE